MFAYGEVRIERSSFYPLSPSKQVFFCVLPQQESPCKRRKRAKKSKPLQIVVPDHFLTSQARTDKQMERGANKVTAMANYVKSTLEKLKVSC